MKNNLKTRSILFHCFLILTSCHPTHARPQPQPSSSSEQEKLNSALPTHYHNPKHNNNHLTILSQIAPVLGESAIIDKETNRVFWQGGKQNLFDSIVGNTYLDKRDESVLKHIRATVLSCILWISAIRFLARFLLERTLLVRDRVRDITVKVLLKIARFLLIVVSFLPRFHPTFVAIAAGLYLVESYTCSTRRFLSNALSGTGEVEKYMEEMRRQPPEVKWQIRCFHYERKRWMKPFFGLWEWIGGGGDAGEGEELYGEKTITREKVVTHISNEVYRFKGWEDQMVAGIWKQSEGTSLRAPFTKISLSKVLLFTDAKAKEDYFKQQSDFVNRMRSSDKCAEFSTNIEVPGYRPKLLAVQPTHTARPTYFWLFTLLGLTVPFRTWFARRCDELRVAVVKETSSEAMESTNVDGGGGRSPSSISTLVTSWLAKSSWFGPPTSTSSSTLTGETTTLNEEGSSAENFRSRMEEMSLYERTTTNTNTAMTTLAIEGKNSTAGQLEEEVGLQSVEHNSTDVSISDSRNGTITTNTTHVSDDNSTDGGSEISSQEDI